MWSTEGRNPAWARGCVWIANANLYPPIMDRHRYPHSIPDAGYVLAARVPHFATGTSLHEEGKIGLHRRGSLMVW